MATSTEPDGVAAASTDDVSPEPAFADSRPRSEFANWTSDLANRLFSWVGAQPVAAWVTFAIVAISTGTMLWTANQGGFLLENTTPTGGDMGAHVWAPAFLRDELLPNLQITGWAPAWYAGFPAFHFYMILPSLFIVLLNVGIHPFAALVATLVVGYAVAQAWFRDLRPRAVSVISALALVLLWPLPYGIAFKLIVISGLATLPLAGYLFGRFAGLAFPMPAIFSVATLLFAYDRSFNIYGGNWASTMAGEFAFSIALSFSLVYLGLLVRGITTGRGRVAAGVLLALTGLSHLIVAFFALAFTAVFILVRPNWRTFVRFLVPTGIISGLLSAFWVLPFYWRSDYLNDMGWTKLARFKSYLWDRSELNPDFLVDWPPLEIVIVVACVGFVFSLIRRNRVGITLGLLALGIALAFIHLPESRLWNGRILPFYYLSLYFLASIGFVELCRTVFVGVVELFAPGAFDDDAVEVETSIVVNEAGEEFEVVDSAPKRRATGRAIATIGTPVVAFLVLWLLVLIPLRPQVPVLSHTTGEGTYEFGIGPIKIENETKSFLPGWVRWNFSGYENKPNAGADGNYAEYHAIVSTMAGIGQERGCGRSLWEFESELNRYGTTMAMMLLPHWTDGCVGSMEGLYFEASSTTPYHFLMQSELSKAPSRAQRIDEWGDWPYPSFDIEAGVEHLQLLGVRYYLAFSDEALAAARGHEDLTEIDGSYPWVVFEVADADLVEPLRHEPMVFTNVEHGIRSWLEPAVQYFLGESGDTDLPPEQLFFASDGPDEWQRFELPEPDNDQENQPDPRDFGAAPAAVALPDITVSNIIESTDTISFSVSDIGTPVLVKASYFPNWTASGADGPYRVTPNLMVVVPTDTDVTLSYQTTPFEYFSYLLTVIGIGVMVVIHRMRNLVFGDDRALSLDPGFSSLHVAVAAAIVVIGRLALAVVGVGAIFTPVSVLATFAAVLAAVLILTVDWLGWWDGTGDRLTNVVVGGGVAGALVASVVRALAATTPLDLEEPRSGFLGETQDAYFALSHSGRIWTAVIGAVIGVVVVAAAMFALGGAETPAQLDGVDRTADPDGAPVATGSEAAAHDEETWLEPDDTDDDSSGFRQIEDE